MTNTETITFLAKSITIEGHDYPNFHVTLEADATKVVEDMTCEARLHEIEPSDIIVIVGATNLLNAMAEQHFAEWIKNHGAYYEALNAIGYDAIREWMDDYTGGE